MGGSSASLLDIDILSSDGKCPRSGAGAGQYFALRSGWAPNHRESIQKFM